MNSWIKCIIFDLDGVIANTKDYHRQGFQQAAKEVLGMDVETDWYYRYDGITSNQKLNLLEDESGNSFPIPDRERFKEVKKSHTLKLISENVKPDPVKIELFSKLREHTDAMICLASNSHRSYIDVILSKLGIPDTAFDNIKDGTGTPKPSSEMFLQCIIDAKCSPHQAIVFEDSPVGKKAAIDSGAYLVEVKNHLDVNADFVLGHIHEMEKMCRAIQLDAYMLHGLKNVNVIVPMAGHGSRFSQAGFTTPKPFIPVRGKPMVQQAIDGSEIPGRYIFCVQAKHMPEYSEHLQRIMNPGDVVVEINKVTEGAACTVLLANEHIDNDEPLFIINSDQYVEWDWSRFMIEAMSQGADGGIVTFTAEGNTKWSYARVNPGTNVVAEVAEKKPISKHATVGIYYWRRGSDFVKYAKRMIENNVRVNNEFYVCPVYNEAIEDGLKIVIFDCKRMLPLGTPEDLSENLPAL